MILLVFYQQKRNTIGLWFWNAIVHVAQSESFKL